MNHCPPAEGLCDTHVTWEDIEHDMQLFFNTTASFGPNKSAKEIGEGKGFMSKLVLVNAEWQEEDDKLPRMFLVKLGLRKLLEEVWKQQDSEGGIFDDKGYVEQLEAMQKMCHNAEVTTYEHLSRLPQGKIKMPKVYAMKKFTDSNPLKGYIIMEYFENLREIQVFENLSVKEVDQILRDVAILQASGLGLDGQERSGFLEKPFTILFQIFFTDKALNAMISTLRAIDGGRFAEVADMLNDVMQDLLDYQAIENLPEELGMDRVLCHGDLWSMNILWKPQINGQLELAAMIDYQATVIFALSCTYNKIFGSGQRNLLQPLTFI